MRILEMHAVNFKGAVDIRIKPDADQNVILITGKNGQGKTSAIDAIWAALIGADMSKVTPQPIREGEKRASVRLDLGEYIVLREWTKNDIGKLTVTSPRGAAYPSPQSVLNGLVAKMSMDPLAFIRLKGPEQVKELVSMLGDALTFDPAEIEARRKQADADRAIANKEVKALEARLAAAPDYPAETPTELVSTSAVLAERAAAVQSNTQREATREAVAHWEKEFVAAEAAIIAAEEDRARALRMGKEQEAVLSALPLPMDIDVIDGRLDTVEQTNEAVRGMQVRTALAADLDAAVAAAKAHDDSLKAIAQEKKDALAAVVFPVDGLSFDEDTVVYNGVALEQASDSEKRMVGFGMAIAQNPELRVIRVDQGESFDEDALAHIDTLAAENDLQVWMTKVGRVDDDNAVVIHEGMVKA